MLSRRNSLKLLAVGTMNGLFSNHGFTPSNEKKTSFRYCLNTSTISGQKLSPPETIEITARSGYDGIELWTRDIWPWLQEGNSLKTLKKNIKDSRLAVECGIGPGEWIVDDDERRMKGFEVIKKEMDLLAQLECKRYIVVAAGAFNIEIDFSIAGIRFKDLIELGREMGVFPQLEFIGSSKSISTLGQAMMVAIASDDEDARILPDVFHMFRGGSGINGLNLLSSNSFEVIHINDYPGDIPREEQKDSHRIFPGDGVAPLKLILEQLKAMGGTKVLSLELFNKDYWSRDAFSVAKTGLVKMKEIMAEVK